MADIKFTQLPVSAGMSPDDIFAIVNDPSGAPVSEQISLTNVSSALNGYSLVESQSLGGNGTLNSGVTSSSLEEVGTLTAGTWQATIVDIAYGGTGAADAAGARTNLGLVIGTNVQAFDADLSALAAISTNGFLAHTGAGTAASRTITGTTNQIDVSNGDGVSGNPTLSMSATYVGQASITTLGTVTTGTWNGTAVDVAHGGTGATSLTSNAVLKGAGTSAVVASGVTIDSNNVISGYSQSQMTTQALTDGATINWDLNSGGVATVTLAGNRTMAAPTNIKAGASYALQVTQDATGGRTLTWNSAFKFPGGTAFVLSTAANAIDLITFISTDGSTLLAVGQQAFS